MQLKRKIRWLLLTLRHVTLLIVGVNCTFCSFSLEAIMYVTEDKRFSVLFIQCVSPQNIVTEIPFLIFYFYFRAFSFQ